MIRTRIAPSPTGYPHIGTIYQALFDFAYAKKHQGNFFVRIEDTDRLRLVTDAEKKIFEALDWFHLEEDESSRKGGTFGPYRQSERLAIYKKYALELIEKNGAYYCFCTKEQLEEMRKKQQEKKQKIIMYDRHCRFLPKEEVTRKLQDGVPHVIRLKIPEHMDIVVHDLIRGDIHFHSDLIEDTVLIKADGYPTYHLASSVVDDHLMQTSHIVRGEEWLPSFPKHIILYDYFGWKKPLFIHTPVLRNPDKSKLSKRQGHTNVSWYQQEGFLPKAILNYLALMAWSHPQGKEIFSLEEFISLVDFKDMKPVAPIFDIEKLKWMNGEYIRMMTNEELKQELIKFFKLQDNKIMLAYFENNTEFFINEVMALAKTRLKILKEFKELALPIQSFDPTTFHSYSSQDKEVAKNLHDELIKINDWKKDAILYAMRSVLKRNNVKGSVLYKVITGQEKGLPLPESLELIGKEKTLQRLLRLK